MFTKAFLDSNVFFCEAAIPHFVLSHWDDDHISVAIDQIVAKANRHPNTAWLAPEKAGNQDLSKIAKNLRVSINQNGRDLHLWSQTAGAPLSITRSGYTFIRVTGNDSNNSGIALRIEDPYQNGRYMLLTGDASYQGFTFNHGCDNVCVGLVASHHGAEVAVPGNIPQPLPQQAGVGAARTIAYSYGMGNAYGHTATEGVTSYFDRGWVDRFRLDTAGTEPDAEIGGARGNIGMVWPNYRKGPGFAPVDACVLGLQHAAISLIASCLAEIRLSDPALAGADQIAVATTYQACAAMGFGASVAVSQVMRRDGNVGGLVRYTAADGGWRGIHQGYPMSRPYCLAVDHQAPPRVYAGCLEGIYGSVDGGATWHLLGMAGHAVLALAIEPGAPATMYAGTLANGVFKSMDGGNTWVHLNNGLGNVEVRAVAVSGHNTQHVYAGTAAHGVYRSQDGGASWAAANIGLAVTDVAALAVAHDTGLVYAGTVGGGLYASTDQGGQWLAANAGLMGQDIQAILFDPASTLGMYVGTRTGGFRSADAGQTWNPASAGLVSTDIRALDVANAGILYAGTAAGVFQSADQGANWAAFNAGWAPGEGGLLDLDVRALKIDTALTTTVYVGIAAAPLLAVADALQVTAGEMRTGVTNVATIAGAAQNANFVTLAVDSARVIFTAAARMSRIITNACAQVHQRLNHTTIGSQAQEALMDAYDLSVNPGTEIQVRDAIDAGPANQVLAAITAINAAPGIDVHGVINGAARAVVKAQAEATGRSSSKTRGMVGTIPAKLPPVVGGLVAGSVALRGDVDAVFGATAALVPATPIWPEAAQPDNFDATVIAIVPNNPARIYAGTETGEILVSADAGMTWTDSSAGLPFTKINPHDANEVATLAPIRAIAIDPVNVHVMYAATYRNGVFRSADAGLNWAAASNGLTCMHVLTVVLDPLASAIAYAGTADGQVFRSADGANNWATASAGLPGGGMNAIAIVINPAVPTTLYVGILGGGIFTSANSGGNWVARNTGLGNLQVRALAMAPSNAAVLYAGTEAGVYLTVDSAANWAPHNAGLDPGRITALLCHPNRPRTMYAGSAAAGVFRSFDYGDSWSDVNPGLTHLDVNVLRLGAVVTDTVYLGSGSGGVFKSTGLAIAWVAKNTGLTNLQVRDLSVVPGVPLETLYAGTAGGVFFSADGGDNWAARNNGLHNLDVRVLVTNPANPTTLYAGTAAGVFVSVNSGGNWTARNTGLNNLDITALVINPANPAILHVGTNGNGVFRSSNGGLNWQSASSGLLGGDLRIRRLLLDCTNPATIFAATAMTVCRNLNAAIRWRPQNTGLVNPDIWALSQLPNSKALHLGTADGRLLTSSNLGTGWNACGNGIERTTVLALAVDPLDPQTVYAGTLAGGALKRMAGQAWRAINKGINDRTVRSLAIHGAAPATVYAGTDNHCVFKSADSGATWSKNVTVNAHARATATVAGIAAQVAVAQGMASDVAARAAVAAARVVVPAVYGAPQVGCHRYPSTCANHVCALSVHYFNKE
ncbi:hypothetical protein RugamoR57_07330 [Duganella caerulea]